MRVGTHRLGPRRLTKYELARVIGTRACQLSNNDPPRCFVGSEKNSVNIALKELGSRTIPNFIIKRYHPDGTYEEWELQELLER